LEGKVIMTEQQYQSDAEVYALARKTLQIFPLLMRLMSGEMRSDDRKMDAGLMALLGSLQFRPHSLSELAERMNVSLPTMSSTVSTAESRGWVTRTRSEKDRRIVWITINPEGDRVLEEAQHEIAGRIARIIEAMPPEQRGQLDNGMDALAGAFARYLAEHAES
jgi:DNA-binding MarR family transcriptional regulator